MRHYASIKGIRLDCKAYCQYERCIRMNIRFLASMKAVRLFRSAPMKWQDQLFSQYRCATKLIVRLLESMKDEMSDFMASCQDVRLLSG